MGENNKFYLTKEGLENLRREYERLKRMRMAEAQKEVPALLQSEELNVEFVAFREDMDLLNSRIEELDYILKNYLLIEPPAKKERDRIQLGAKVSVDVAGQDDEFVFVGTLEADPSLGRISNECPVGRALIGHMVGEEVVVSSPIKTVYKIKKIKY